MPDDSKEEPPAQPEEALDEEQEDMENAEVDWDAEDTPPASMAPWQQQEEQLDPEVQERLDDLRDEYGELSELLVDVAFNPDAAEFVLDVEDTIRHYTEKRAGKARFYLHREPTDEFYLLLSPKPAQFNASWLTMQDPNQGMEAFERYADDVLRTVMVDPTFEEVDWNLDGSGVYQPMGLTKSRLVDTFLTYELQDPNAPNSTAFSDKDVDNAIEVARDSKPSL